MVHDDDILYLRTEVDSSLAGIHFYGQSARSQLSLLVSCPAA